MNELVKSVVDRTNIWTLLAFLSAIVVVLGVIIRSDDALGAGIGMLMLVGFGRGIKYLIDND